MKLQNRDGRPVDAVPFLVAATSSFLLLYSFAPGYLLSMGFDVPGAIGLTTAAFLACVVASYHWFVWRARQELRDEVPAGVRFRRLVYAVLIAIVGMGLLMLPIVLQ